MSESIASKPSDEDAIRGLYQQMIDGWNRGNGTDLAAPFDENCDFIVFDGTHLKDRQEIATCHQSLFDTFLKGSRLVGKVRSVRFLTPDVAVMHGIAGTVLAGKSDIEPERNSVLTFVAIKREKKEGNGMEWRVTAFQNTRAQYIGRPEEFEALTEELRQMLR